MTTDDYRSGVVRKKKGTQQFSVATLVRVNRHRAYPTIPITFRRSIHCMDCMNQLRETGLLMPRIPISTSGNSTYVPSREAADCQAQQEQKS